MKRIALLLLGLCTAAGDLGCCCSYYSRQCEWDDACVQSQPRARKHGKRRRRADRTDGVDGCSGDDCCDCCCDSCCNATGNSTGQPVIPSATPMYDNGAMMQGGCATGNCGSMQTYSGTPFDPSAGWTIQSTTSHPVGNEPVMAPGATSITPATPITPAPAQSQGWAPSSAPLPGPVPPPLSSNR